MPSRGKARRAVWEATVNSCCEKSLFIVSSLAQRLRQAWSPDHTHIALGSGWSRHCIQLQGSQGPPLRDDSINKETQEATRTAGKIPLGPPNQTLPVQKCSPQHLPQQTKHKNTEPAANPT